MSQSLKPILVIGSSNTDMVIKSPQLPAPGETILGGTFFMNAGGKGANQAVAAVRLGGGVTLCAKVGNDAFGDNAVEQFKSEGIRTDYIVKSDTHPSGVALIMLGEKGENCISVASGANAKLTFGNVEPALQDLKPGDIVLAQLEIPLETVIHVLKEARKKGATTILNPAPAFEMPVELYQAVNIITPNETEAELLSGINVTDFASAKTAASIIKEKGADTVIITLGAQGALVFHNNSFMEVPATSVTAVDSTAAGDVFNGALAVALAESCSIESAVHFACKAAAISVTRLGAQASAPYRKEISTTL